jgi:hypothetical protein
MNTIKARIKMSNNENLTFHNYEKLDDVRGQWMQVFDELKMQIMDLPDWAQGILMQDISSALQNRIVVMHEADINSKKIGNR